MASKVRKFLYEVEYRDSRMGDLRCATVLAEDEGEAYDIASEDYYFGSYLGTEELYEVAEENWKDYD